MDIRSFFAIGSSSLSAPIANSSEDESGNSEAEYLEPSPPKKRCVTVRANVPEKRRTKSRPLSSKRKYNKKWEEDFPWLEYDEDHEGAFCKLCRKEESHFKEQEEHGSRSHSTTGRRQQRK